MSNSFKNELYLEHDVYTQNDIKIKLLKSKFGIAGYGMLWAIYEHLATCNNFMESRDELEILVTIEGLNGNEYIQSLIDSKLLKVDEISKKLFSQRLLEKCNEILNKYNEKSQKLSENGKKGAEARWKKPNSDTSNGDCMANNGKVIVNDSKAMANDSKDKDKDKDKEEDKSNNSIPLTSNTVSLSEKNTKKEFDDSEGNGSNSDTYENAMRFKDLFNEVSTRYDNALPLAKKITAYYQIKIDNILKDECVNYDFSIVEQVFVELCSNSDFAIGKTTGTKMGINTVIDHFFDAMNGKYSGKKEDTKPPRSDYYPPEEGSNGIRAGMNVCGEIF